MGGKEERGGKDRRRGREKGRKYRASYKVLSYQVLDFDWWRREICANGRKPVVRSVSKKKNVSLIKTGIPNSFCGITQDNEQRLVCFDSTLDCTTRLIHLYYYSKVYSQ